ncbi:MAG: hypothetical protein R6U25_12370 [Alkalispirochaeta sp.]
MERTVILVFGVSLLLGLMFIAGNYQSFADTTQLQLLRVLQGLSGAVTLGAVAVAVLIGIDAIRTRVLRPLLRSAVYLAVSGVSLGLAVGSSSLLVLFRPL